MNIYYFSVFFENGFIAYENASNIKGYIEGNK